MLTEPGVPYNVTVVPVNGAGQGEFSVFIHFTRELCEYISMTMHVTYYVCESVYIFLLTAPNIAPQNLSVNRTSPTVMVVSWTPLSYVEARGFISHYTVAYSPQTSGGRKRQVLDTMFQTVPGMDSSTTRIEGLDPDTVYTVQVSATTGGGTSTVGVGTALTMPTSDAAGIAAGVVVVLALLAMVTLALALVLLIVTIVKCRNNSDIGMGFCTLRKRKNSPPTSNISEIDVTIDRDHCMFNTKPSVSTDSEESVTIELEGNDGVSEQLHEEDALAGKYLVSM